ncbi:SHOCT domain-containing protein [Metaclostridioides mangenotii]|uniref:Membrane protein n=1 Tax=Metaclostridioides mangenotii TaxID=1540 RepID=A0ABS4EBY0_9FIRM|nr:SHOCT domain-containing protein [Clostridioides mangenotii]MBP1855452.1 putative membrane protein [Clostridioides mangenotii]
MDLTLALIGISGGILGYAANREDEKELAHLKELLDMGEITEDEFNTKKKELLNI